jgi:hypothetical protein
MNETFHHGSRPYCWVLEDLLSAQLPNNPQAFMRTPSLREFAGRYEPYLIVASTESDGSETRAMLPSKTAMTSVQLLL